MPFLSLDVFIADRAFDGPMQMAIDELLLESATEPALRFYRWAEPAATFGCFQPLAEARAEADGLPLTRRWTGGGVVLHRHDLTFSLIVPRPDPFCTLRPLHSYRAIHDAVARALRDSVAGIRMADASDRSAGAACFANPALHDLVTPAGKLAGGAQRRTRKGVLHQGSIQPGAQDPKLAEKIAHSLAGEIRPAQLAPELVTRARALATNRYASAAWLCRR